MRSSRYKKIAKEKIEETKKEKGENFAEYNKFLDYQRNFIKKYNEKCPNNIIKAKNNLNFREKIKDLIKELKKEDFKPKLLSNRNIKIGNVEVNPLTEEQLNDILIEENKKKLLSKIKEYEKESNFIKEDFFNKNYIFNYFGKGKRFENYIKARNYFFMINDFSFSSLIDILRKFDENFYSETYLKLMMIEVAYYDLKNKNLKIYTNEKKKHLFEKPYTLGTEFIAKAIIDIENEKKSKKN